MAVVTNKNILTKNPTNVVPSQITNDPVQNQNLAVPVQQVIPVYTQPVQQVVAEPQTTNNQVVSTTNQENNAQQVTNNNQQNQVVEQQPQVASIESYTEPVATSSIQSYNKSSNSTNDVTTTTTNSNTGETSTWVLLKSTDTDLTTTEGQYQSAYADTINTLVENILNARFEYNPEEDELLQLATKYATNSTLETMNSRGILNSSMTGERIAKVISDLTYQYQELAKDEFNEEFNRMITVANLLMSLDETEYQRYIDNRDYQYQLKQDEYQKELDAISQAWERVDNLGYVDNEASQILGLAVGTLSKDARERIEDMQDELEMYQKKLDMERESDLELYKLKAEIDAQYSTSSSKSSSSSSSNQVGYSDYLSMLKNQSYITKDVNGNYVVTDVSKFADFLETQNTSGYMSDSTLNKLLAYFGLSLSDLNTSSSSNKSSAGTSSTNIGTQLKSKNTSNKGILEQIYSQMNN
jgi:hypothetical protein